MTKHSLVSIAAIGREIRGASFVSPNGKTFGVLREPGSMRVRINDGSSTRILKWLPFKKA